MTSHATHSPSSTAQLKNQLTQLEKIQEIDLKIRVLNQRKSDVPKELLEFDKKLTLIVKRIADLELQKTDFGKVLKQSVAALELNSERMGRTHKKLEDVGNSREFQAATKEVDQLKRVNDDIQIQKEKTNTQIQEIDGKIAALQNERADLQQSRDQKAQEINTVVSQLDQDLGQFQNQRQEYIVGVDRSILTRYDRVREAREGLGLVPAVSGRCSGCNMMILPQLYNQLHRAQELIDCPNCKRILFIPSAPNGAADKASSTPSA